MVYKSAHIVNKYPAHYIFVLYIDLNKTKLMFKDKSWMVKSFITSSLFLIFLKPIVEFIWSIIVLVLSNSFTSLLDGIYESAASTSYSFDNFLIVFFLLSLLLFEMIKQFIEIRESFADEKRKRKMEGMNVDERKDFIKKENENIEKYNNKITKNIRLFYYTYLIGVIALIVLLFIYPTLSLVTKSIGENYQQRITILSPYTSDQKIKQLKSDFARMEKRDDFKKLIIETDSIAKAANIKLKELVY